jgi:pimeloyl-ACP methyl ester carboxylesterase
MQLTEFKRTSANPAGGLQITSAGHTANGIIAIPNADRPVPSGGFPVLIFFHGAGAASQSYDLTRLYSESALPQQIKNNLFNRDFIVLALQDQWATPSPSMVAYVLQNKILTSQYSANPNKVYVTGLSFGGGGSLAMALHYPQLIAGVVSASPSSLSTNANSYAPGVTEEQALEVIANQNIPVAFWVGKNDGGYVQRVASYYDRLFTAGDAAYKAGKIFTFNKANTGHGPWSTLYFGSDLIAGGQNMYDFLLQFEKGAAVEEPEEPNEPEEPEEPTEPTVTAIITVYSDGTVDVNNSPSA